MPPRILPGKTLDPTQSTISVVMSPRNLTSFSLLRLLLLTCSLQDVMFTTSDNKPNKVYYSGQNER
jgi:hypothetical protein